NYEIDDGQELTSLAVSADGKYVVYVRGGDHGSNFDSSVGVNPGLTTTAMKVQIWSVPFAGGEPKLLAEGDEPLISPKSDRVVFVKERGIWSVPIDGSTPANRYFYARGDCGSPLGAPVWHPPGTRLQPWGSFLHRRLHKRLDSDRLSCSINLTRFEPTLVARW